MPNLSHKEIRQRTPYLLAGLLLANFALMAWNARDRETGDNLVRVWVQAVAAPVQTTVTGVGSSGTGFFADLAAWRTAVSERDAMKSRIGELETEINQAKVLQAENERLKGLLELRGQTQYKTVTAQVIGRDPSGWFESMIINRGSSSGIELNMPVVTSHGVVGRVVAVSPITSQIALLSNDTSAVGAVVGEIGNSGKSGLIKGTSKSETLEMRYVSGQEQIEVGTPILTTGQDKIYPAGLKIGEVAEVKQGSATSPHVILVKAGVPASALKEVSVLLYTPHATPAPEKSLPNVKPQGENKRGRR